SESLRAHRDGETDEGIVAPVIVGAQLETLAVAHHGEGAGNPLDDAVLGRHPLARQVVDGDHDAPGEVAEVAEAPEFGARRDAGQGFEDRAITLRTIRQARVVGRRNTGRQWMLRSDATGRLVANAWRRALG